MKRGLTINCKKKQILSNTQGFVLDQGVAIKAYAALTYLRVKGNLTK